YVYICHLQSNLSQCILRKPLRFSLANDDSRNEDVLQAEKGVMQSASFLLQTAVIVVVLFIFSLTGHSFLLLQVSFYLIICIVVICFWETSQVYR
ncbi:unnamed protein product, partial [Cylicocyclus nassatus]